MTCEKCGSATKCVNSTPVKDKGPFREEYECAQGHTGYIVGGEGRPADQWNRFGEVFDS